MGNLLSRELKLWNSGLRFIAGVDEAGSGPLAGPVVAAAVILDSSHLINDVSDPLYTQIKDSKLLSPKNREVLFDFITANAISYSIFEVSSQEIDEIGISAANKLAFYNSVLGLETQADYILTDFFKIPQIESNKQTSITRGDNLSISIAAASILAKVHRDRLMLAAHETWPDYGFDRHKGYGTLFHRQMLAKHGPCEIHRRSFTLLV